MRNFGAAHRLQIRAEFGPSGRMRERIERGERVDLFASADIGHARALVEFGFASAMVMFAGDLMARSTVIDAPPGSPPPRSGDAYVDALQNGRIDLAIVYSSGRERYARLLPDAELIPFPPRWEVGPEYALTVLNNADRRAADLAFYMLSPEGQVIFAQYGFVPVALPTASR
jgi:molybdate transport system substrate-binding protein